MHYFALILVSSITLVSTVFAVKQGWVRDNSKEQTEPMEMESAFAQLKIPLYFEPVELEISQTKIQIEQVGLQNDGTLDTPSAWDKAGWYSRSQKPGQPGNVIIDGHYDTDQGKPAAFWGLKTLLPNDKVVVKDEIGRLFTYKVVEVFYVDITDPERAKIFGSQVSDKAELTLVTCGGVWDPSRGTYDRRLVIRAELVSAAPAGR